MTADLGAAASGDKRAERARRKAAELRAQAEQQERFADRLEKGNAGERQVAGLLDVLDGAGWVVLNDRYKSAASPVNIDHIVVGPPGVVVVDSKNWTGHVRLDDRGMAQNGYRRDAELLSARTTAETVQYQANRSVPAVPANAVIAFVGDVGLPEPVVHGGVTCLQAPALLPWLTGQPARLTPQEVQRLAASLDAVFPPRAGSAKPLTLAGLDLHRSRGAAPGARATPASRRRRQASRPRQARAPKSALPQKGLGRGLLELTVRLALVAFVLMVVLPVVLSSFMSNLQENLVERPAAPPATTPPVVTAP